MRNLWLAGTFAAGVGLTAVIAWWLWPQAAVLAPQAYTAPAAIPAPASAPVPAPQPMPSMPLGEAPAPWASPSTAGAPAAPAAPGGAAGAAAPVTPELELLQRRLTELNANGRSPTGPELDALLAELQASGGSNVLGGVRLDVLRANLAKAEQLQVLAVKIEAESKKPGGGDLQVMQAYLKELQQVQSELQLDVMAEPAGQKAP